MRLAGIAFGRARSELNLIAIPRADVQLGRAGTDKGNPVRSYHNIAAQANKSGDSVGECGGGWTAPLLRAFASLNAALAGDVYQVGLVVVGIPVFFRMGIAGELDQFLHQICRSVAIFAP